ncbi:hypothetical protein Moror_8975 [Moniliophthora roreri MCA 2997]|uniref:HAT C-terminal dimerisation domain-containing protein n=1 Tax=Moniliophthora roreri (strain MCA 2997) TaxID=1381753 RepID=V2XGX5_MONRO|nr:hypothetical protein Moror_8975 [Moniliophthora roreri MCA 2997]
MLMGFSNSCGPHVINLAVQDLLWFLPLTLDDAFPISDELKADNEYHKILEADIVTTAHTLVSDCHSSGQRRANFKTTIENGNKKGGFGDPPVILHVITLLQNCTTCWSSTFFMVNCVLEMILAIDTFISDYQPDIPSLTTKEHKVLNDVRQCLLYSHSIQESVSSERTPMLHLVIPLYEDLYNIFKMLQDKYPKLSHALGTAMAKLNEYLKIAQQTKIYGLALAINPLYKFEYIHESDGWTTEGAARVKEDLCAVMLEYQSAKPDSEPIEVPDVVQQHQIVIITTSGGSARAACAQQLCHAGIKNLKHELSGESTQALTPSVEVLQSNAEAKAAQDRLAKNRKCFPLIWRIAMDILPAQVSAVPCKHVFSSSKQTDSCQCSNLSTKMIEILQILKYSYQEVCFVDDLLLDTQTIVTMVDLEPEVAEKMISEERLDELKSLLAIQRPGDS